MSVSARALLRPATVAEVTEALERNPGSQRLADQGHLPAWFEVEVAVDGGHASERSTSVVWRPPDQTLRACAEAELEYALDDALRNLRDYEGVDVERDELEVELVVDDGQSPSIS